MSATAPPSRTAHARHRESWRSLRRGLRVWRASPLLSFGGPAGQIAVMHRILVDEKRWIREERFLHALNYCMLLPGPEAQQLATYIGWLMHGTRGGLIAGMLFVLPGFCRHPGAQLHLRRLRQCRHRRRPVLRPKAAVLADRAEAVIRIGKRALKNRVHDRASRPRPSSRIFFFACRSR